MSGVQTFFMQVIVSGILVSLVLSLTPKGAAQKGARFCGSLVMMLAVLSPLLQLNEEDFAKGFLTSLGVDRSLFQQQLQSGSRELLAQSIKEQCEAYVWDKASTQGIEATIEIILEKDEEYPYPKASVVQGTLSPAQKQYLQRILENEMGIPILRQEWITP